MTNLNIRPYKQEDALEILTDPEEKSWAKLNEVSGPGVTYEYEGKIVAVAGIRTHGIGEIWASFTDTAKGSKRILLKESKQQVMKMMKSENLWQVIATTKNITPQQAIFLKHLGFEKCECYVKIREEK